MLGQTNWIFFCATSKLLLLLSSQVRRIRRRWKTCAVQSAALICHWDEDIKSFWHFSTRLVVGSALRPFKMCLLLFMLSSCYRTVKISIGGVLWLVFGRVDALTKEIFRWVYGKLRNHENISFLHRFTWSTRLAREESLQWKSIKFARFHSNHNISPLDSCQKKSSVIIHRGTNDGGKVGGKYSPQEEKNGHEERDVLAM